MVSCGGFAVLVFLVVMVVVMILAMRISVCELSPTHFFLGLHKVCPE